jgi:ferredoxin
MRQVRPEFLKKIKAFGTSEIESCFNCGNCTAVCPLSENGNVFPRKLIRYVQLGDEERLSKMAEPWLCYYCGECSSTCPRNAGPGELMAALRRYSIAKNDPTGLANYMFRKPWFNLAFSASLAIILSMFLLSIHPGREFNSWLFKWIPYEVIHTVGMFVSIIFVFLTLIGIFNAILSYSGGIESIKKIFNAPGKLLIQITLKTLMEILLMNRHSKCDVQDQQTNKSWFLSPRWLHLSIMWGFLGLLCATALDFVFVYFLNWTIFVPARVIGTVSGLVMLYGVSISIYLREKKKAAHLKFSVLSDWWLLFFLLVLTVTGFWIELVVTFRWHGVLHEIIFLIHTVMAMELILLFVFTKFAHAVYRPLALWFYFFKQAGSPNEVLAANGSTTH